MIFTNISPVIMARHALVCPPLGYDGQLLVPDHLPHVGGGGLALDTPHGDHLPHAVVGINNLLLLHTVQSSTAYLTLNYGPTNTISNFPIWHNWLKQDIYKLITAQYCNFCEIDVLVKMICCLDFFWTWNYKMLKVKIVLMECVMTRQNMYLDQLHGNVLWSTEGPLCMFADQTNQFLLTSKQRTGTLPKELD